METKIRSPTIQNLFRKDIVPLKQDCNNSKLNWFFVNSWGNPKNEIEIFNKCQKSYRLFLHLVRKDM